jgi:hypothetical protein
MGHWRPNWNQGKVENRLVGCRVDLCIHELVRDVFIQYWYQSLCKNFGFVNNKHQQLFVVGALLGAWLILETNVTLFSYDGGSTHVMPSRKTHLRYTIQNPTSKWACCNCVNAQCGNICKHQLKVLMFLHPNLTKGTITRFCGPLKGTLLGGFKNLISPQVGTTPPPPPPPHPHIMTIPPTSIHNWPSQYKSI